MTSFFLEKKTMSRTVGSILQFYPCRRTIQYINYSWWCGLKNPFDLADQNFSGKEMEMRRLLLNSDGYSSQ